MPKEKVVVASVIVDGVQYELMCDVVKVFDWDAQHAGPEYVEQQAVIRATPADGDAV